jgi:hypothetical protein
MNRGLENGFILGNSKGIYNGLNSGLVGSIIGNRLNMLNPSSILDPKIKPVFYINGDNVALNNGTVQTCFNQIETTPNQLFTKVENIFDQTAGTTYRPSLVVKGLNGKNYINFADTGNRYLASKVTTFPNFYASTAPQVTGTGFTYIFVIKRKPGATYSILDGRDSTTLATTNDILIEVNAAGRITFDYKGGNSGLVTSIIGTAGVNLLNDWSILTIKCQLRIDGGLIPTDGAGPSPFSKRFAMPETARIGSSSPIDIFVNGIEQQKTITTNNFTNADHYNDGTFRMLDRDIFIGNKGAVFGTSGTHIAAALMIPAYISKTLQTKIENYFRYYYNLPF